MANTFLTDLGAAIKAKLDLKANASDVANKLDSSAIGVTVQAYDATTLKSAAIGTTVQGYDANTVKKNVANTFTAAQRADVGAIAYAAFVTLDLSAHNHFQMGLNGGNTVIANPTNMVAGQEGTITLIQDATGGRTVAWGTYFKWVGGTAPTYVTSANSKSTFVYHVVNATEIIVVPLIDWK